MDSWPARLILYLEHEGRQALADYLPRQRWFGAKGRQIVSMRLLDHAVLAGTPWPIVLAIVVVEFHEGQAERYFMPLLLSPQREADQAPTSDLLCTLPDSTQQKVVVTDATADTDACLKLANGIRDGLQWRGCRGTFRCMPTLATSSALSEPLQHAKRLSGEQSNTSVVFDRRVILKLIRKFDIGINPDREILEFLTTRTHYQSVPPLIGTIEYHGTFDGQDSERSVTVGLLQIFIPNDGDGWSAMLEHVKTLLHDSRTQNAGQRTDAELRELVQRTSQYDAAAMRRLGAITAELHTALSSDSTNPAFRPEQVSQQDVSKWRVGMTSHIRMVFTQLRALDKNRRADLQLTEDELTPLESGCERQLDAMRLLLDDAVTKIRVHGDYHLGQVLKTGQEFIVLDFEGEPARPLEERRAKQCALKDVAGMLRSFNYAGCAARRQLHEETQEDKTITALWERIVTDAFWGGYTTVATPGQASFMPKTQVGAEHVLRVFELDKTIYEIGYELNNRPDWLDIPLQGLRRIVHRPA